MYLRLLLPVALLFCAHSAKAGIEEEEGIENLFASSPDELENVVINFTGKVPHWLVGSLIRVGPALFELGEHPKSSVTSALDGHAKIAHWNFLGNSTALFSTKFINSTYRIESLAKNKFTSNIFFSPPQPSLSAKEIERSKEVGIDNMDINIVVVPQPKTQKPCLVATNDILSVYEISPKDLSTVKKLTPIVADAASSSKNDSPAFIKQLSTAHPLPEPEREENLINVLIQAALAPGEVNLMKLIRIKSYGETEVIASWVIPEVPLLHSFSLSRTKAVILMNPYIMDVYCKINNGEDCYKWKDENKTVTVYVVDLRTGNVKDFKIPKIFVLHHINAFDLNDDVVIADVASYKDPIILSKLTLSKMRDPAERKKFEPKALMQRIEIYLKNNTASLTPIKSLTAESRIASTLDYPNINEANRSKPYCFVYGIVEKMGNEYYGDMGIAKKDVCVEGVRSGDALFSRKRWYPQEPIFVASPGSVQEDDGVLLVPYTEGAKNLTHLLILNATDLSLVDMAEGPILIPYGQHGKYLEYLD